MTVEEVTNNTTQEGRSSRRRRNRSRQDAAAKAPSTASTPAAGKGRPTPARREQNGKGNFLTRIFRPIVNYFSTTRAELEKVTWPTRQEGIRLSGIVIAVTVVSSIALGVLDYLYGELFRLGFNAPLIFVVFGAVLVVIVGGGTLYFRQRSGH